MTERRYGDGDASFQAAGGVEGVQQLVEDFYDVMDTRDYARRIRDMHPEDLTLSIDKLARFLCGWLGGPRRYREKYGGIAIPPAHSHLPIVEDDMRAWLVCMEEAAGRQPFEPAFREYLLKQLAVPASRIVLLRKKIDAAGP